MAPRVLIVLFIIGIVGGFGSALVHHARCGGWHCGHAAWRERVADVCVQAARRTWAEPRVGGPPGAPPAAPSAAPSSAEAR